MAYNSFGLKAMLTAESEYDILESLGVHGLRKDSNGLRSSCPIHNSNDSTVFVYNPDTHLYCCYGGCIFEEKDGDLIKLVQLVQKCNYDSSVEYICEIANIDIKLISNSDDWIMEELKNKIDSILNEAIIHRQQIIDNDWQYGVQPIDEALVSGIIGRTDSEGYIEGLGFKDSTLTLFESGFDSNENRWVLPIRCSDGKLLGFDGRDITNKRKDKWKKRKGLLTNKLLGRLDISSPYILENDEICLVEGKKDQMALYDAGIKWSSCIYGSSLSDNQLEIIENLCSTIVIFPDGDAAGYKMVKSVLDKAYPEYNILVCETPDEHDPYDLTIKYIKELYGNKIHIEEWIEKYKYRNKKSPKKK